MSQYCHFHPNSPAKWRCTKCNRLYDNACLPKANEKLQQGQCPLCSSSLKYLATSNVSNNIQHYPFNRLITDSFSLIHIYLIFAALGLAIVTNFININPMIEMLLCFSLIFLMTLYFSRKHAFAEHNYKNTSRRNTGRKRSAETSLNSLSLTTNLQLTVLCLLLLLFPVYCFYSLHWFLGLLLIFSASAIFPFLIIFSAHSSDDDHEITLSKIFKDLKPAYFQLICQCAFLYWLVLLISDMANKFIPSSIGFPISTVLSVIALSISVNLSTRAFMLSLMKLIAQTGPVQVATGPESLNNQDKISSLDIDIDQALKTGQYLKVVSLLEDALKRNSQSNLRRQQLFLLLSELQDFEKLQRYAGLFLYWMLDRNKIKDVSQFIYQLRKNNPAFLLHDLGLMNSLAKVFLKTKKYALVLWLAEDTKTRFQVSEELASLYLSAVQALITHYQDLEKAEEYLLFILQKCSEYQSAEAAKALLIHLQHNQKQQDDLRL